MSPQFEEPPPDSIERRSGKGAGSAEGGGGADGGSCSGVGGGVPAGASSPDLRRSPLLLFCFDLSFGDRSASFGDFGDFGDAGSAAAAAACSSFSRARRSVSRSTDDCTAASCAHTHT